MSQLYVLREPEPKWGDYGHILCHGFASRSSDGRLELKRTAPFMPPVSFPWPSVVVTDAVRRRLEPRGFTGFQFRDVIKKRIVRLEWHLWDKQAAEPSRYPAGGEPEDYILRRRHNRAMADALGALWEVVVPESPGLQIEGGAIVNVSKYHGQDICRGSRWGYTYVSGGLKSWLESEYGEWVSFTEAPQNGSRITTR